MKVVISYCFYWYIECMIQMTTIRRIYMNISDILSLIFGVFGAVTGLMGLIISILSYNHNKIEALNLYFIQARDSFLMEGKKIIYNLSKLRL